MNIRYLIPFSFFLLTAPAMYGQAYKGVVENFYKALGNRDFASAYNLCTGLQRGTLSQFSSTKMYGGIYDVAISSVSYKSHTAEAEIDVFVKDSVNGDGRYIQRFFFVKQQNQWLIQRISLLQTDRAEKGWNLKLVQQAGLTIGDIEAALQSVYDTVSNEPDTDKATRTLQRAIGKPQFFQMPGGVYALVVAKNQLTGSVINMGWCDAFVFQQRGDAWEMTDCKLHAGGGGMYGNSGEFKNLLRAGDNITGLVIAGGQMHLGDLLLFDDILAIEDGKLYNMVSIVTQHRRGEFGSDYANAPKVCDENSYKFIRSGKQHYDLQIIHTSCKPGISGREKGRVVIPCVNRSYALPAAFVFSAED